MKTLVFFALVSFNLFSQTSITFQPLIAKENLILDRYYYINDAQDSFKIETLRFYIANISLYQDAILGATFKKKYNLFDIKSPNSMVIMDSTSYKFNRIEFIIGIDSLTNMSGVMEGDMDPMHGMYWTWQSGYINFKLEGSSNLSSNRKNQFQYHIGGYQYPFNSIQKVSLKVNNQQKITVKFDLKTLLNEIGIVEVNQVMSPSELSNSIAQKIASLFYIDHEK